MRARCDPRGITEAARILSGGGVVVFPTDTVYGIGCDPFDKAAVGRIYSIKNRDPANPLPVLAYSAEAAREIARLDGSSAKVADRLWPGPLTIVLGVRDRRLRDTLNVGEKVAVRVPGHRCTLDLLRRCRYLVGTSANVSGAGSATDPAECERSVDGYDLLLDGGVLAGGGESTIIEFAGGELRIHREGAVTREEVLAAL